MQKKNPGLQTETNKKVEGSSTALNHFQQEEG